MGRLPPVAPLAVYYDDRCGMCAGAVRAAARHDRDGRLRPRGISSIDPPFPAEDVVRELHAVDAAGTVYRGYDAVVAIMASSSRYRRLAPLLGTRLARWLGVPLYRTVARHRRRRAPT